MEAVRCRCRLGAALYQLSPFVQGLALVTINYRLGILGFLASQDLMRERQGHAGNLRPYGHGCGVAWVQANIAKFGGDPGNVTISVRVQGLFRSAR